MRGGKQRRVTAWAAIVAIALQTAFGALTPQTAQASGVDPFTVICHSGAQDDPASQPAPAAQDCAHCVLCSAAPAGVPPADLSIGSRLAVTAGRSPLPAGGRAPSVFIVQHNLARGPPGTA